MCVEGDVNGVSKHSVRIPVEISKPWRYDAPVCTPLGISSVVLSELGRCSQSPVPTPSVGTLKPFTGPGFRSGEKRSPKRLPVRSKTM